jgi:hypothetical protein
MKPVREQSLVPTAKATAGQNEEPQIFLIR